MTISMYQASVPRLINGLTNLSHILGKAQAHAEAKKLTLWCLPRCVFTLTCFRSADKFKLPAM